MKKINLLLMSMVLMSSLLAQTNGQLEVIVHDIKNDAGIVMVGLFNSSETFTKKAWKGEKSKAKPGTIRVIFHDIPSGNYAVSAYHDVNENGKLDMNFLGIPKEGFGFSNDAMGTFGPPSFEKAMIKTPTSGPVSLKMKYF
jgi:uncharacterized protein (DUF2141 family)